MTNTVTHTISIATTSAASFDGYTLIGPVLSFIAALIAVRAVIWSQRQFDRRQRNDHIVNSQTKTIELLLSKKEELSEILVKLPILIATVFDKYSHLKGYTVNHTESERNLIRADQLLSLENNIKCKTLIYLYFNNLIETYDDLNKNFIEINNLTSQIHNKIIDQEDLEKLDQITQQYGTKIDSLFKMVLAEDRIETNLFYQPLETEKT